MSDEQSGSSLLTEGGGNPAGQGNAAAPDATQAAGQDELFGQTQNGAGQSAQTQTQQNAPSDWRAQLPEELRGNPSLGKLSDVNSLAQSYVNLEKLLGSEKVPLPKGDNDTDGWSRLYTTLGRPEAADKYAIDKPTVPDGMDLPYDEGEESFWRKLAFENGLSQKQFKNMWDTGVKSRLDKAISWQQEAGQAREKAADSLKRQWGQNYDGNLAVAKAALNQFANPDYRQWLESSGEGNNPHVVDQWYKVGRAMNGQTRLQGAPNKAVQTGDLDRQIADYRSKFGAELMDSAHPSHKFHVAKLTELFQQRHPD